MTLSLRLLIFPFSPSRLPPRYHSHLFSRKGSSVSGSNHTPKTARKEQEAYCQVTQSKKHFDRSSKCKSKQWRYSVIFQKKVSVYIWSRVVKTLSSFFNLKYEKKGVLKRLMNGNVGRAANDVLHPLKMHVQFMDVGQSMDRKKRKSIFCNIRSTMERWTSNNAIISLKYGKRNVCTIDYTFSTRRNLF